MKRLLIIIINYLLVINNSSAQGTFSLEKAQDLAQNNYPLIKQRDLIRQTTSLTINNLSKGFLPQFSLSGHATYQSEVTEITVPIPGFTFNAPSKDQYKVLADINQLIYDGGVIKEQKDIQRLNDDVEQQKIEVELYKIKDRINQVFLGILFLDEQINQVDLTWILG
jgi:outer membrane protein TolC